MSPQAIGFSLLILGVALLIGKFVRVKSSMAQNLFLPSSIIGGALLLLLGPQVLGRFGGPWGEFGFFNETMITTWKALPGLLISVIFATMFLGQPLPNPKRAFKLAGPQLSFGVAMGSGQYVVGLLLTALILIPAFSASPMSGALIEIAFEGGHGTAAGMRDVMIELGFETGADLAVGLATVGIVGGIVIGIAMINWAVRTGKTKVLRGDAHMSVEEQKGLFRSDEHYEAGKMTSRPASVEPLSLHMSIMAVAIIIGWVILEALRWVESLTWGKIMLDESTPLEIFSYVPLFPMALIGGVIVQWIATALKVDHIIDHQMMLRIQGWALDFLIVAAMGTLSLAAVGENLGTFLILAIAGIIFNVAIFLFLAPRVLGYYWFERGIGDFGQGMGVTATGLILMRVVDPKGETPAFEAFGYKQLIFEPFFGGGMVTALAVPIIFFSGIWPLFFFMLVLFFISAGIGLMMQRKNKDFDGPLTTRHAIVDETR
ncbi:MULTISPECIES: sodium/glutamate symporter [unclassified Rothia (in: high G+C Gram-positive bacteria)]|uniref:sodium/glutamate symporter n=1 Tax=unclassified Rothia (in: high G+C Gram-positive bacteria) TaxID=2689056 RepID=UPI00195F1D6D|nr:MULTISPECIES: sodium:glutamate symporter [unclassified Rothia (in: high G+C Gram-positive bacteria)]MBM7051786.1 sodium:glutamate symporter [Rothia sp. ZJ1223]QRZ61597.1 sodium:glutamate symporter [Rothia sp. ZJ932]